MPGWTCGRCTFDNHELMSNCEMCDAPREAAEIRHLGESQTQDQNPLSADVERQMYDRPPQAVPLGAHQQASQLATDPVDIKEQPEEQPQSLMDADIEMDADVQVPSQAGPETDAAPRSFLPEPMAPVVMHSDASNVDSAATNQKQLEIGQKMETGASADLSPVDDDLENDWSFLDNEMRIVLIGKTGVGKSTTGNNILNTKTFKSSASGTSVTRKCQLGWANRSGRDIQVIDTPGLFDTGMTNEQITREVVKCVGMTSPGPHAFVLVIRLDRFTAEEKATVDHFVNIFGKEMLNYLIVLFTRKDDLKYEGRSIDDFVKDTPDDLKKFLESCHNRYLGIDNRGTPEETQQDVQDLFEAVDKMVSENGGGHYTNEMYEEAERVIVEEEEARIKQSRLMMQQEMQRLRQEVEDELRRNEEEKQKNLVSMKDKMTELGINESDEEWLQVFGSSSGSPVEENVQHPLTVIPDPSTDCISGTGVKQVNTSVDSATTDRAVYGSTMNGSFGFCERNGDIAAMGDGESCSSIPDQLGSQLSRSYHSLPHGGNTVPNSEPLSLPPRNHLRQEAREVKEYVERLEQEHNEARERMRSEYMARQAAALEAFKKHHSEQRNQTRKEMENTSSGMFSRILGAIKRVWKTITDQIGRALESFMT